MTYRFLRLVVPFKPNEPLETGNVRKVFRLVGPGMLEDFTPHDLVKDQGARLAEMLEDAYENGLQAQRSLPKLKMPNT